MTDLTRSSSEALDGARNPAKARATGMIHLLMATSSLLVKKIKKRYEALSRTLCKSQPGRRPDLSQHLLLRGLVLEGEEKIGRPRLTGRSLQKGVQTSSRSSDNEEGSGNKIPTPSESHVGTQLCGENLLRWLSATVHLQGKGLSLRSYLKLDDGIRDQPWL